MESIYVCLLSIMILYEYSTHYSYGKVTNKIKKKTKKNTYHNFITVPKFNGKRAETVSKCMP